MLRSLFLLLCLANAALSSASPVVAVMPLQASEVTPGEVALVTDAIGSHLQKDGAFRVLERSQMEKILSEQGFQQSGACDAAECAVQAGQMLGIDRMVVGSVGRLGAAWVLNLRMVSVSTGEVLASTSRSQKGEIADLLTDLAPLAVEDLLARGAPAKPAPAAQEAKGGSGWVWWTLGGVALVGGGAVAAVLLLQDDAAPATAPAPDAGGNSTGTGTFEVKWGN